VSKARLDLALGAATGELLSAANDSSGIAALRERLLSLAVARVVLEASGGLETALVAELGAAGLVNPRQVRLRTATGQLAKTDALDAIASTSRGRKPARR
jgi:transposase